MRGSGVVGLVVGLAVGASAEAQTPLNQPGGGAPYLGQYELGLYRDGANEMPDAHRAEGLARANAITPLDTNGNPDPNGKIVLIALGMSNTMIPFCEADGSLPTRLDPMDATRVECSGWSFMGRTRDDAALDSRVQIVNGAYLGQSLANWVDDNTPTFNPVPPNAMIPAEVGNYDRVRDMVLIRYTPQVTEAQVQVAWVKMVNDLPVHGLPGPGSDAESVATRIANALRFMKTRYPHLSMVFLTSASYRGWGTAFNPEPQAYETGFSVKWVIDAQITQIETGNAIIDPLAGDLDYTNGTAPWLAWGPYLWANGPTSRTTDGYSWVFEDYAPDGVHHTQSGQSKYAILLLYYFTFNRFTHCWFVNDGACE